MNDSLVDIVTISSSKRSQEIHIGFVIKADVVRPDTSFGAKEILFPTSRVRYFLRGVGSRDNVDVHFISIRTGQDKGGGQDEVFYTVVVDLNICLILNNAFFLRIVLLHYFRYRRLFISSYFVISLKGFSYA